MHIGVANLLATVRTVRASTGWRRLARFPRLPGLSRMIVDVGVVVDVCNVRDIGDARVRDVHVVEVITAHAIPRNEGLTEAQSAPSHSPAVASSITSAKADARAPSPPAKPRPQRRRLRRT